MTLCKDCVGHEKECSESFNFGPGINNCSCCNKPLDCVHEFHLIPFMKYGKDNASPVHFEYICRKCSRREYQEIKS